MKAFLTTLCIVLWLVVGGVGVYAVTVLVIKGW